MLGRTDRRLRMIALLTVLSVLGSATAVRLGYWQVVEGPTLRARAQMSIPRPTEPQVIRGDILDHAGVALAQTVFRDRLVAYPELIPESRRQAVIEELARILEIPVETALSRYGERLAGGTAYEILERQITPAQSLAVEEAKAAAGLGGVALEWHQVRHYPGAGGEPDTTLASLLLGFVDAEGRGRNGVEQAHDDRLTARSGPGLVDLASIGAEAILVPDGGSGGSQLGAPPIRLTIDAGLQRQLETELHAARVANGAKRVSGLVMDPHDGAILAWASVPGYDANNWRQVTARGLEPLRDPIVSDAFAPGSVMKALTAAAALWRGTATPRTRVRDSARLDFPGSKPIRNADHKGNGNITLQDAIAYSRNVATARIAANLDRTHARASLRLYQAWERLGIGRLTGIDVAGESAGIAPDPRTTPWMPIDLANRAFGQGVSVTLIQLAHAYAPFVNGGFLVQPHVTVDGPAAAAPRERVLEPKVARQMQGILERVTGWVPWYAKGSLIPGYRVGGKTGTAQVWDSRKGRFLSKAFDFSFVGFVGADEPEVLIAVRIQEGRPRIQGQGVLDLKIPSYALFRNVARAATKELGIRRSRDPDMGFPIAGSPAEERYFPKRLEERRKESQRKQRQASRSAEADAAATTEASPQDQRPRSSARRAR
jgi:cell division protein FtsI (penicillin-binding protein 3)